MLNHEIANICMFSAYTNGNLIWFNLIKFILEVMDYGELRAWESC